MKAAERQHRVGGMFNRREFVASATALGVTAALARPVLAQEGRRPPTPSTATNECDGVCQAYPFILIRRDSTDVGVRSTDVHDFSLGPETQDVWFEVAGGGGGPVTSLQGGVDYVTRARVWNLGAGAAASLCVDFLVWVSTSTDSTGTHRLYDVHSSSQGLTLMPQTSLVATSQPWTPAFGMGLKPGDAMIRAYDVTYDAYTDNGVHLYANRDRHLAHRTYT